MLKGFLTPVTKRHVERKILSTHPMHLYRIIQDVDSYSKFLPMCSHSKVLSNTHSNKNTNTQSKDGRSSSFQATLTVGMPPLFQETYVSDVFLNPTELTVETKSIQSKLFDSLRSKWKLSHIDGKDITDTSGDGYRCQVNFEVEMTVSDPFIIATLDEVLKQVAGRQVEAFEKRCRQVPVPNDILDLDLSLEPLPKQ
jgi:ribosome-associated toxin RatA of RatAB toxin-antitoxin module